MLRRRAKCDALYGVQLFGGEKVQVHEGVRRGEGIGGGGEMAALFLPPLTLPPPASEKKGEKGHDDDEEEEGGGGGERERPGHEKQKEGEGV